MPKRIVRDLTNSTKFFFVIEKYAPKVKKKKASILNPVMLNHHPINQRIPKSNGKNIFNFFVGQYIAGVNNTTIIKSLMNQN